MSAATDAIDALADAPPVDVPVTADTTEASGEIGALADAPPVDVPVSASVKGAGVPGNVRCPCRPNASRRE